jgi:hypothetical protein
VEVKASTSGWFSGSVVRKARARLKAWMGKPNSFHRRRKG